MASTGHGQRDPQPSSDLLARVGVFVGLFGIGLSTLLATVAVQEQLGPLWFTLLLSLGISLVLGGGAGSIYSLVAVGRQSAAGKPSWRAFRGAWTYPRTIAIAAGVLTSVILAVSLLFVIFRTGTPLTTATSTTLTTSPASPVVQGTEVTLTATVTPATAGTVQFKDGTTNIGTPVFVTNGTASMTTSTVVIGSHQLSAVFAPTDPAAYGSSTSPPVTFVVIHVAPSPPPQPPFAPAGATATSTVLITSPASSVPQGTQVTLTAAVTPAAATGTVQFRDGTANIGTPVTVTNGTASGTTSTLAIGSHQLRAVFTPTTPADYGLSTSQLVNFVVTAPTGR